MGNGLNHLRQQDPSFLYEPLLSSPVLGTSLLFKNILLLLTHDILKIRNSYLNICVKEETEKENLRVFSAKELKKATKRFRKDRVVTSHDGSVQTFYKGYINDTTSATSRTKTKVAVSVMECLQHSPRPKHVWKISKVCRFLTLVFISIVTLCT